VSAAVVDAGFVLYLAKIKLQERRKVLKRLGILLNGKKTAAGDA